MSALLAEHWPHLIFVFIGVLAFLWIAYRPERDQDHRVPGAVAAPRLENPPPWMEELRRPAPARTNVRRSVARRGLLALGPLLGAVATGAVLYGADAGVGSVSGAVIWAHAGISALALLLVVYKVGDLGVARIRRAFTREGMPELVSIVLAALSVPLTLTGVVLLFAPSTGSFFAYTHLISSAWWTGLLAWHLRRYLGASMRAALGSEHRPDLPLEDRDVAGEDVPRTVRVPG